MEAHMPRHTISNIGLSSDELSHIDQFVETWKKNPHVVAIILTGSWSIQLADAYSDIDLYVIFSDAVEYRQRGDSVYGTTVIEYNADPVRYILRLQEEQHRMSLRHCARKITTGIVLFKRGKQFARVLETSRMYMTLPFPAQDTTSAEMAKYYMWDQIEDLRRIAAENPIAFPYAYHCGLQNIINHYAKYVGVETLRPIRMHAFLTDASFREKYRVPGFLDNDFVNLASRCMESCSFENIERLTVFVQEKMGGFSLDGWVLRVDVPS
jgi:hypothetical protein